MLDYRIKLLMRKIFSRALSIMKINHFYQNINFDISNNSQKKVLIAYIDSIFEREVMKSVMHTNFLESFVIVKTFIDMGYCIDVIGCDDIYNINKLKNKKYDIIFGLGKPYEIACNNNKNALKIVYLTECAPDFSCNHETERCEYYYERHNKKVQIERSGLYFNNKMVENSDYGIFFGNQYTIESFNDLMKLKKIYTINPTGLINKNYKVIDKNFDICKRNFLWFGSYGAIHKGLDLLLDVFSKNKGLNLYIAGLNKKEEWLLKQYKNCKNIINCGFIDVQSDNFIELINKVGFVILPSASEGMSTSVLTCMKHGLIPVVTRNVGIDVDNIGIFLEDYKIEYLDKKINEIINMDDKLIRNLYNNLITEVKDKYELQIFEKDFIKIIHVILNTANGK